MKPLDALQEEIACYSRAANAYNDCTVRALSVVLVV